MTIPKIQSKPLEKIATGIEGFDEITAGGLPRCRTTLLTGGPGCGKTVLALQALVNNARTFGEGGIFVAFEEDSGRILDNAESFGWKIDELRAKNLFFLDARLSADVVKAGVFDLSGLLMGIEAMAHETGAKLIVFDAIDVLLSLLNDPAVERRELYRIHEWLVRHEFTGILTAKVDDGAQGLAPRYGFMPFMADCVVHLTQRVAVDRVGVRAMRLAKYRGSLHVLNEVPFVIGPAGVEVGSSSGIHPAPQPFKKRISTGIDRLDAMLCGGIYRGTNALITGSAGVGKTTLAGLFLEAACRRGERALFVSFDENSLDIARDLASVGVDLTPHVESGLLRMEGLRTEAAASEDHLVHIKKIIREQKPACLAIDPLSVLENVGGQLAARNAIERLIYFCRNAGITAFFTSLLEGLDASVETTPLRVSTLADTWMQITYLLYGGERNRALTVIKSRGSKHSNQVRELIFSDTGVTLADPYMAGGEVLMGTLRIEKENAVRADRERLSEEIEHRRREVELIKLDRDFQIEAVRGDLKVRDHELEHLNRTSTGNLDESALRQDDVVRKRDRQLVRGNADAASPGGNKTPARAKSRGAKS